MICSISCFQDSLVHAIVRMAQGYTGSNNLPLLLPLGQFGTRHAGGEDAASSRYIYTKLRLVFNMVLHVIKKGFVILQKT